MASRKYPIKRVVLKVKMRCDYCPNHHTRCTNMATRIVADKKEGRYVFAYCPDCFKNYQEREQERRKMGID